MDNIIELKRGWFERYGNIINKIDHLEERRDALDMRIKSPRVQTYSDMPKGGTRCTTEDLIIRKADIEEKIKRVQAERKEIRREILEIIGSLHNASLEDVLELKYIYFMTTKQISVEMGYTPRYVSALMVRALKAVEVPGIKEPEEPTEPEEQSATPA